MGSIQAATSNPLLPLFKEQLEAECAALAIKHGLTERGHFLIFWYFIRLKGLTDADVGEIFCDGGGDLGLDAIWIDEGDLVHFYQFKNPHDPAKGIPAGEVDKTISGLRLILNRQHDQIANSELKARVEEIYQMLPKGYRIHLISSGRGLEKESKIKLDALVNELKGPSSSIISWDEQPLATLQEMFYQQNLPAVKDPLKFSSARQPYTVRSGVADCYLFHATGQVLADLYESHGEGLLQRNIRVDQGETATNKAIETTCIGADSPNFLHFNNGVTFLCERAGYDQFLQTLTLDKAQVVNGGQTIRALHRAMKSGSLKADVLVPARVITSSGDKDFANNVAVNQNNQNPMGASFLRSNDQRVVQLDFALAALGWYLERRDGELESATPEEKAAIETRIRHPLDGRIIRLKEGAQAYTATFYGQPEVAKKNPGKIFLSVNDGGHYERIFSADMTAEKMVIAHEIKMFVDEFVRRFGSMRRKLTASDNIVAAYEPLVGPEVAKLYKDVIHQVLPQCALFLCGTLYKDLVELQGKDPSDIPLLLKAGGNALIQEHLLHILNFANDNKNKADKSWPVLLKSNAFFSHVCSYLAGIRKAGSAQPQTVEIGQTE
jgi:AIPR protein